MLVGGLVMLALCLLLSLPWWRIGLAAGALTMAYVLL